MQRCTYILNELLTLAAQTRTPAAEAAIQQARRAIFAVQEGLEDEQRRQHGERG